jgi:hypothetical protein
VDGHGGLAGADRSSAVLGHGDAVLPHLPPRFSSELGHQLEDLRQTEALI